MKKYPFKNDEKNKIALRVLTIRNITVLLSYVSQALDPVFCAQVFLLNNILCFVLDGAS